MAVYPFVKVELELGGQWIDITTDVYLRARIHIAYGQKDRASRPSPSRCRLHLKNTALPKYSPVNVTGPYYGLIGINIPIRVSVTPNGTQIFRFTGRVPTFPLERNKSDKDRWVAVDAFGPFYPLQGNPQGSRDAMRRFTDVRRPLSYWTMTEGKDARQATEVIAGGPAIRPLGRSGSLFQDRPSFGTGSIAPWLDAVVELKQLDHGGTLTGAVSLQDVTDWAFDHARSGRGRDESLFLTGSGEGTTADPSVRWQVNYDADADDIKIWSNVLTDSGEVETLEATVSSPGIYDADPHHLRFTAADDGAGGTDWALYVDGALADSGTISDPTGALTGVTYIWAQEDTGASAQAVSIGHFTYWDAATAPTAAAGYTALLGHQRELAGRRIERLAAEDGVALEAHGDLDDTQPMGPQQSGTLLDLIQAAVDVDGGTLGESRQAVALVYRTCRSKYDQGVSV